jgi:hypothetical protein
MQPSKRKSKKTSVFPLIEAIEQRWMLTTVDAGVLTGAVISRNADAGREGVSDGSGNKLVNPDSGVVAFTTSTFSRVETSRQVLAFADTMKDIPDSDNRVTLAYTLYRDVNANKAIDGSDTVIDFPEANQNFELDGGSYLYVITATSGDPFTRATVKVNLRSVVVGGAKANLSVPASPSPTATPHHRTPTSPTSAPSPSA